MTVVTHEQQDVIHDLLDEVLAERVRQLQKWGPQRHGDIYKKDLPDYKRAVEFYKSINDARVEMDIPASWDYILLEEVAEALSAKDEAEARMELLQCAAVCLAWVEDLDSRGK